MTTVTLRNSFHNTEVKIRVPDAWVNNMVWLNLQYAAQNDVVYKRKLARVKKALCGMSTCSCGTVR